MRLRSPGKVEPGGGESLRRQGLSGQIALGQAAALFQQEAALLPGLHPHAALWFQFEQVAGIDVIDEATKNVIYLVEVVVYPVCRHAEADAVVG